MPSPRSARTSRRFWRWHEQLATLAERLVAAMRDDAFTAQYLCVDATGVLVQAKEKCRRARFWVLIAPERHVPFEYTRDAVDGGFQLNALV